jgi:hypothetical protein
MTIQSRLAVRHAKLCCPVCRAGSRTERLWRSIYRRFDDGGPDFDDDDEGAFAASSVLGREGGLSGCRRRQLVEEFVLGYASYATWHSRTRSGRDQETERDLERDLERAQWRAAERARREAERQELRHRQRPGDDEPEIPF